MKTIQSTAQEMIDNMKYSKRNDGTEYVHTIKTVEWQKDIIRNAHGDMLPDDDIYSVIYDALLALAELPHSADREDAFDALYEIEAPVYTSELTAWLHRCNNRAYYLEDAIKNGLTDGFQVLAAAWCAFKDEIGAAVISGIVSHIEAEVLK